MSPDSHWSENQTFPTSAGDCREPAMTTVGNVLHAVWTQDKKICHAYLAAEKWSEPKAIGIGRQSSLVSSPDGRLHCAFSAEMLGNVEIYICTWDGTNWGLPQVVSRTTGSSMYPALAAGTDGSLHVAWTDTTPGYATVYYGHREGTGWTSIPIPNGRGGYPTIGVGHGGEVYVAWQSRLADTARFEVLLLELQRREVEFARGCLRHRPATLDLSQAGRELGRGPSSGLAGGSRRWVSGPACRPPAERLVAAGRRLRRQCGLSPAAHHVQPAGVHADRLG